MKKQTKGESDLLIESMQKLIDHMNDSKQHQEEIFQSLTPIDVQKILTNFEDKNQVMRKTSAAFLCELVFDNPTVQKGFCEVSNILPMDGKICVNKIPQSLLSQSKHLAEIFETIKSAQIPFDNELNYPLCWYFENQRDKVWKKGVKFIKFEKSNNGAKSRIEKFIDPQLHLFGFIIANKKEVQQQQDEIKKATIQTRQQQSVSTYEQNVKRIPNVQKVRPNSGQSPIQSVSPIVKRQRMMNASVDYDTCGNKSTLGKTMIETEQLQTISEVDRPKSKADTKKSNNVSNIQKRFK
ncbi:unnamed protein product (macronuclear) [Paramecium tetraurelia]|uniref:Uncharacterized protein n=1 Tax=Paramecium tetraurelia TaxID=5888 RepID=A0D8N1_PARTE|nr:uncharacterized protein GSPATT00014344001 [Paramecium tetraurelia]CAK79398.1 unnamed protein product [Paramecium tetraurelia]|eukprot:XP_001446795.1 hypothetical protein (macronuclear) [Paramecium tetraurelia strain d4-2]